MGYTSNTKDNKGKTLQLYYSRSDHDDHFQSDDDRSLTLTVTVDGKSILVQEWTHMQFWDSAGHTQSGTGIPTVSMSDDDDWAVEIDQKRYKIVRSEDDGKEKYTIEGYTAPTITNT
jgi:hypothetical protein